MGLDYLRSAPPGTCSVLTLFLNLNISYKNTSVTISLGVELRLWWQLYSPQLAEWWFLRNPIVSGKVGSA